MARGWHVGRRGLAWHLTFPDQPELARLAAAYRSALAVFPGLDPVPDEWLHLTMQTVGFTDEAVAEVLAAARESLARIEPFDLELTRPVVTSEAIRWDPPGEGPARVRDAVRDAMRGILGEPSEDESPFAAHVSIAYANRAASGGPVARVLESVDEPPAIVRVANASLIRMHRDKRMYVWDTVACVPLGR